MTVTERVFFVAALLINVAFWIQWLMLKKAKQVSRDRYAEIRSMARQVGLLMNALEQSRANESRMERKAEAWQMQYHWAKQEVEELRTGKPMKV